MGLLGGGESHGLRRLFGGLGFTLSWCDAIHSTHKRSCCFQARAVLSVLDALDLLTRHTRKLRHKANTRRFAQSFLKWFDVIHADIVRRICLHSFVFDSLGFVLGYFFLSVSHFCLVDWSFLSYTTSMPQTKRSSPAKRAARTTPSLKVYECKGKEQKPNAIEREHAIGREWNRQSLLLMRRATSNEVANTSTST